jgi:hypothetical protein
MIVVSAAPSRFPQGARRALGPWGADFSRRLWQADFRPSRPGSWVTEVATERPNESSRPMRVRSAGGCYRVASKMSFERFMPAGFAVRLRLQIGETVTRFVSAPTFNCNPPPQGVLR